MKCICGHDKGWHFIDAMGCKGKDVCCHRDDNDELSCECHKYIRER
jgi:hypothetical protein